MDKKLKLRLNGNRDVISMLRGFDQFLNLVLVDAVNDSLRRHRQGWLLFVEIL